MASTQFILRGGSEPEYQLYRALYSSGRKEPRDFVFKPASAANLSFVVYVPFVGILVGDPDQAERLLTQAGSATLPRIEYVSPASALADGRSALKGALGG